MRLAIERARVLLLGVLCALWAGGGVAHAQALGYAIAGPSGVFGFFGSSGLSVRAGGGEVLVAGRAGAGGEVGVLANGSNALLVFSANGALHLSPMRTSNRHSVFTGGYTHMGSGDVRPDFRGTVQYWTIRVGVSVR